MKFIECFKIAWQEAKKAKKEEEMKKRFLDKKLDYVYLEKIVEKINENPLLEVRITLHDGTFLSFTTRPKQSPISYLEAHDEIIEVK